MALVFLLFNNAIFSLPVGVTEADYLSNEQNSRRTLRRFTKGTPENQICWNNADDGYQYVVDMHNHFQPFGGPGVPHLEYMDWMSEHGILFSVMVGIGQRIMKSNPTDPDCCYYLHCPTTNYTIKPTPYNDILNADFYTQTYLQNTTLTSSLKLILSLTSLNLQHPETALDAITNLTTQYPDAFGWFGELNIVKQALAGNGFFTDPLISEADIVSGQPLANLFKRVESLGWPITLHSDLGCDNFNDLASWPGNWLCELTTQEITTTDYIWYMDFLGPFYEGFFNGSTNTPKSNFPKLRYLKLFDAILTAFPDMKVTWAHMGLARELLNLHPRVHTYILKTMFDRHSNLHTDISWDIISQLYLMDYANQSAQALAIGVHPDLPADLSVDWFNLTAAVELRVDLFQSWMPYQSVMSLWGNIGDSGLDGPTLAMAVHYPLLVNYSTRFLTGTDFVASYGTAHDYPGLLSTPKGCQKTIDIHGQQLTDTSSISVLFTGDTFRNIFLGENFFRILNLSHIYTAPPLCPSLGVIIPLPTTKPIGAIVGGVLGGAAFLGLAGAGFCYFRKRHHASSKESVPL